MPFSGSRIRQPAPSSRVPAARLSGTWIMAMLVASMLGGCGYTIRAPFDKNVKTVFVPIFRTQSYRRDLNVNLCEMIQKEIMYRSPYKVVGRPEGADTVLEGTINFADKNTVVDNPFNLPRELNVT